MLRRFSILKFFLANAINPKIKEGKSNDYNLNTEILKMNFPNFQDYFYIKHTIMSNLYVIKESYL
jgi:hypothetical protein